jgi:alpha-L-fucosidase
MSFEARGIPNWFEDDKIGVMIVWGVFSVPGWAPAERDITDIIAKEGWGAMFKHNPYAEWYMNTLQVDGSPTAAHHKATYGENFAYDDFIPQFQQAVRQWDPATWADLFQEAGIKYTVFLTKHHDGFLLWDSRHPNPHKPGYQVERDVPGELAAAVRDRGIRFGIYYSGGLDWTFKHETIQSLGGVYENVPHTSAYATYADAHWRELIERYQPALMWNDIAYPRQSDLNALFADYYAAVPDGVINDRFAQNVDDTPQDFDDEGVFGPPPGGHHDFRTPEYTQFPGIQTLKWETCRGTGNSFSYNQNENPDNMLSPEALVHLLADIVSKNGNLLLSFGPMADGTIPAVQADLYRAFGAWLAINGEAIYHTRPWTRAEGTTAEGVSVRFTRNGADLYAILLGRPAGERVTLHDIDAPGAVHLLGDDTPLNHQSTDGSLIVDLPPLPESPAYALKLSGGA